MKRKILLAGGNGFIGKNIREQLGKKYNLFSPSHKELDFTDTSAVGKYFQKHSFDTVIYAINIGGTRKTLNLSGILQINLRCFFNVVSCSQYFKKMIFFGSGAEYDKRFPIVDAKESEFGKKTPIDDYGLYKFICSQHIANAQNITSLRLFGVFGKYEDYEIRFISQAICRNLFGLPIVINKNVYFDYLYVNDLIRIVDFFISHKPKEKFYNVGRGERIDLITLAKVINKVSRKPVRIIIKQKGLQNEYTCDTTRLKKTLGKFEYTKIEDAIRQLYHWYGGNKSKIDKRLL